METDEEAGIFARESTFLDGYVQLGVAADRVISVTFPAEPDAGAGADHPILDRVSAYLEGEREDLREVAVGLTVATDHRSVLEAVREVPYGENATVEQIARMTPGLSAEDTADQDTVRTALAENPVPLVVPDHRIRDGPSGAPPAVETKLRSLEGL